ncbi:hypothetical protein HK100_012749 [Physocladia obscura]|uniref:Uncharacterized protein n=1 Tax=Physocladia obscura TaxID=109957 RepID=A0AAD5T127_9FUNG|nr:hypothetical protein HK100_012749 [Physocladia obscura]
MPAQTLEECYRWSESTQNWKSISEWVGSANWGYAGSDALATDPIDPTRLYIAAVMYSNSWDPNNGFTFIEFYKASGLSGTATSTIFAGIARSSGPTIYQSNNAGTTSGQPQVNSWLPHKGQISSDGYLYVSYSTGAGPFEGTNGTVWRYTLATKVWTDISPYKPQSSAYYGYGGLTIDIKTPSTIMVAALNSWQPDGQIYRSTDPTNPPSNPELAAPNTWSGVGFSQETLVIDPFNSDGLFWDPQLSELTNLPIGTGTAFTIQPFVDGIEETAPLDLISPSAETAHLFSYIGDISGFKHTSLTTASVVNTRTPEFSSERSLDFAELNQTVIVPFETCNLHQAGLQGFLFLRIKDPHGKLENFI